MLKPFLLRWLINGLGLWVAARIVPGITYNDSLWVIIIAALIFSIVNALIRPILVLLSLPAIILTLGLFTLFINAFMLYLVTVIYHQFVIEGFGAALLAVIIIWLVNHALNTLLQKEED